MADTIQPLIEFVTNILSDLDSGAISAQEAIAAGNQYGYVRETLDNQANYFSQTELISDGAFTSAVRAAFQNTLTQLGSLASFQNQPPDQPIPERTIRSVATLRAAAVGRIKTDGANKLASYQDKRRAFIHELVEKFSSTAPKSPITEASMGTVVDGALASAAAEATSAQTRDRFAEQLIARANITGSNTQQFRNALNDTLGKNDEYISAAVSVGHEEKEMLEVVYTNLGITRPDVLTDVLLNHSSSESIQDAKLRAIKLAGVAADLESHAKPFPVSQGFFTASTARGVTKGAQQAAGGILSIVGEPLREIIIKEKVSGSLRTMFSNTQGMIDRLGENFVQSNVFARVTASLNRSLGDRSGSQGAGGVFSDVFSTVFRGPLAVATAHGSREQLFNFYELARANANAPKGHEFLPAGALPWNIHSSGLGGFFGSAYVNGRGAGRQKNTSWIPVFGLGAGLGAIGSLAGNAAASGFDRLLSFFMSSPRIGTELSQSRRSAAIPTPIWADPAGFLALIVVATLVLLFVVQSPLNGALLNYSAKVSALLASLTSKEGDQGNGSSVNCTRDPTNNLCTFKSCPDCKWPTNGYITQGPDVSCDNNGASHKTNDGGNDWNSVDFGSSSSNAPVYSVTAGTVIHVESTCDEGGIGNTCGGAGYGGYGNNVVIKSGEYTIIYGHLNKAVNPEVRMGATIPIGTQLGWINQTGSSTGPHLHFGVFSGGSVLDLLPDAPFDKNKIQGCLASWLSLRCLAVGKSCPIGSVAAQ